MTTEDLMNKSITPVIKWVGGKRQLLPILKEYIPTKFNKYYEPFFGGGALFFYLKPKKAVINDFNIQLMSMYQNLCNHCDEIKSLLDIYQNKYNSLSKDEQLNFYYSLRNKYNQKISAQLNDAETASLLIFLNKSGFNGLYRVNKEGNYNVPSAHRTKLHLYDKNNLIEVSKLLKNAQIMSGDFEQAVKTANHGDFVFFDSPYFKTFDNYQADGFSIEDHKRLANIFDILTNRGVKCILTNSDTAFIKELYSKYNIKEIYVKRMVNRNANNRTGKEVLITNFNKEF